MSLLDIIATAMIGFGLFLIKQLADQVEFNQGADGGHVIKMAIKMNS